VLLAIGGKSVKDAQAMLDLIAALPPGEKTKFGFNRSGKQFESTIAIGKRPLPAK